VRYLLALLCLPAFALNNSVRLDNAGGSAQTSEPRTIHRYFAKGEFPAGSYPKPRIDGATPATWQVDVENTWPDGSVMAAFVSMPVTIASGGSVTVDFVKDSNACHLGTLATCQAAALDQAGMLAFNGGTWDATLAGTANGVTYSASARTILTAGAWSYLQRGPVVTRVLVEDTSRPNPAFDFGWEYSGGAWQAPSGNQFKSAHPLFAASFYAGWSGVEVEAILQNPWTTRGQRLVFDIAASKSGPTSVYSKSAFDLPWGSQFSKLFWDGLAPGAVLVDYNLRYMISTRLLPPFDYTQSIPTATVNALTTQYDTRLGSEDPQSCTDAGYCGNILKYQGTTGGRADIGLVPQWILHYLFAMGDTANYNLSARQAIWNKQVIGNSDAALTQPVLFRELGNGTERDAPADGQRYYLNYQSDQTTPAWGKVYSVQSRPAGQISGGNSPDAIAPVCSSSPCATAGASYNKGWSMDLAHVPSPFFVPYMLTGRYSYLQGLQGVASWGVGALEPNLWYGNRNQGNGITAVYSNFRATAWALRELHYAALASPDSDPQKLYFRDTLRHNSDFYAGMADDGTAQSCTVTQTSSGSITYTGSTVSIDGCGVAVNKPNGLVRNFPVCAPIVAVTSVTVNGTSKTVGVLGVDSGRDWYYTPGHQSLIQATGAAALTSGDTLVISYTYGARPASDWCHGRGFYARGMPNPIGIPISAVGSGDGAYMGHADTTLKGSSVFMSYYILMVARQIETTGAVLAANGQPLFKNANAKWATFVLDPALKPGNNPYFMDSYTIPVTMTTGTFPQSWSEYFGGFFTQIPLAADVTSGSTTFSIAAHMTRGDVAVYHPLIIFPVLMKIDSEWVQFCSGSDGTPNSTLTVCTNGRGMFGTAATSHTTASPLVQDRQLWNYTGVDHNYSNLYADTIALFEDLGTAYGSGRRAWERVYGSLTGTNNRNTGPNWLLVPRDRIQRIRATPGTGTLALAWTAPSGAACKVAVSNTAPVSSDDSSDADSTAHGRAQTYNATGLSSGTAYWRITCGTARSSGTATVN